MKYYLVYLLKGKVVTVNSYDNQSAQLKQHWFDLNMIRIGSFDLQFDDVQALDSVD